MLKLSVIVWFRLFVFNLPPTAKVIWRLDHSLNLIRQTVEARDQTAYPGLQRKWFIHYDTAALRFI